MTGTLTSLVGKDKAGTVPGILMDGTVTSDSSLPRPFILIWSRRCATRFRESDDSGHSIGLTQPMKKSEEDFNASRDLYV